MQKLLSLLLLLAPLGATAQETTLNLLSDIRDGEPWPCLFYEMNGNDDIAVADAAGWMNIDEDESYWQQGVGPFSNDQNMFFITDWASELRPILIRRHFFLTDEEAKAVQNGKVTMEVSYDENPVVYLNGTRIASYSGWNDNNYATNTFSPSRRRLIQAGDNVVAISVKQGAGGGHIDLSLKAVATLDGIETISTPAVVTPLYDLQGRTLATAPTKGIYIQENKKVLK